MSKRGSNSELIAHENDALPLGHVLYHVLPKVIIFGLLAWTMTRNKVLQGLGTSTRLLSLYENSVEKSIGLPNIYIKASTNVACGVKSR